MGMDRRFLGEHTFFTAKAATGAGEKVDVAPFNTKTIYVATSGSANMTIYVQISHSVVAPDWASAASASNQWSYVQLVDLSTGTGSANIALTGTDIAKHYNVQDTGARWMNVIITAYSAGSATVKGSFCGNT